MIIKYLYRVISLPLLIVLISCQEQAKIYELSQNLFKTGDSIQWKNPDLDDQEWTLQRDVLNNNIFWVRQHITLLENSSSEEPLGLLIHAFGSYEVYWDGVLIGKNGEPGNEERETEKSEVSCNFIIPTQLSNPGVHVIALRASQRYLNQEKRPIIFHIQNYDELLTSPLIITLFMHILAGAFLITAIYFLILFLNTKKGLPILLFSISCFLFFLLILLEYIKLYIPIHYTKFYLRLEIIGFLTLLIAILIPLYFLIQFRIKMFRLLFLVYVSVLLGVYFLYFEWYSYDATAIKLAQLLWIASFLTVTFALYHKRKGAPVVVIGLLCSLCSYYLIEYDISLFLSFTIILVCMFYVLTLQLKDDRLAHDQSIAQSARLKHELLKKKIQPHFLMNTLTSLIDWVEESPKESVFFIEALAEEFELINQIEDKILIPITQEIALCKSHLKIMSYRKEIDYIWEEDAIDRTLEIPPAIIHTLVENGITHGVPIANTIRFKLLTRKFTKEITITLKTYAKHRRRGKNIKDGTGNTYIKARLTESYGNRWDFVSTPTEYGWKTILTLYI
ncbi:histidine kinase [Aquimarina sp. 2-A2]|uniref:histidine kinase n=1 Tax=Aquimarina sp. 2-A2 TaxID=3382644 RepID=UPI00387F1601